ncbi:unnamed protein product, partial [marine sediment metagenome]
VFGVLYPILEFEAFRLLHLVGGVLLLVSTILRAVYLGSSPQQGREEGSKLWKTFIDDNRRALRTVLAIIPGMIIVCIIDSISDSFFKLGALIYMYKELYIDVPSMVIMFVTTLVIQVPLILKVGRIADRIVAIIISNGLLKLRYVVGASGYILISFLRTSSTLFSSSLI